MKKVTVIGAGLVGKTIVRDLAEHHAVCVIDPSLSAKNNLTAIPNVEFYQLDFLNDPLPESILESDVLVTAVPGFLGFRILEKAIELGKNIVDISFFPEDSSQLDSAAKQKGVTVFVDAGVAPGMSNLIAGHHYFQMEKMERFACYVGGLPVEKKWPFFYKAPFSPIDVIEEYTRPARFKVNGKIMVREALSDLELLHFPQVGTLEAFNTDGLRSLLQNLDIPDMVEKTLRYPGHANLIMALQEIGFFSEEKLMLKGQTIAPIDLTTNLLLKSWKLNPDDEEFTLMRIIAEGFEAGQAVRYQYDLFDKNDSVTGMSSMARTTGFTCTALVNLLLNGPSTFPKGIIPLELAAKDSSLLSKVLAYQEERGVKYSVKRV